MTAETAANQLAASEIVFVDDTPQMLQLARAMLQQMGYRVASFACPLVALDYLTESDSAKRGIALLITDQSMPKMTGLELISAVRKIRSDLYTVLATSVPDTRQLRAYLDRGADAVLPKPFTMDDLRSLASEFAGAPPNQPA
ncbi:MAG: response regulator [Pseudomonadota bacterium]